MIKKIIAFIMSIIIALCFGIKTNAISLKNEICIINMSHGTFNAQQNTIKKELSSIKSERVVSTKYDFCQAVLVSDEIYYIGYNYNKIIPYIFTLNNKDKIKRSAKIADCAGNIIVKQIDDKIYVMYNTIKDLGVKSGLKITGLYCKIFDKELNLIDEYNLTSFSNRYQYQTDINENKIFYVKKTKIYSVGFNGKNKKTLLDLSNESCGANFITAIAATNDYVAFTLQDAKNENYYGTIDLKTGKKQIKKNNDINHPQVYGESIIWSSKAGFTNGSSNAIRSSKKIITFKDGQFQTIETKTDMEAGYLICSLTNDGDAVTFEYSESKYGDENVCVRMYNKSSKCIKEFITEAPDSKGYHVSSIYADDCIIAINFRYENKKSNGGFIATTKIIKY